MSWMPESVDSGGMSSAVASSAEVELAREVLLDITTVDTIGEPSGSVLEEDGVITLFFDAAMAGYAGWRWTVSLARVEGGEPLVLESELTPGAGALLSPDWVPWSERLAEYKEAQAEIASHELDGDDADRGGSFADGSDDVEDFDDDDMSDDDLDSGDFDGVDIDSLDDSVSSADSDLSTVGDDEPDEAEGETDDAHPQPPVKARRNQRSKKQK